MAKWELSSMAKKDSEFKEYLDHFSPGISKKIQVYATERVFKHKRYIFTRREGKQQFGYCTYCRKEFETIGLEHNTEVQCPICKSICIVKASGRGRSKLVDEAYFVYYEKSLKDPGAIVARGILAVRDFRGAYWRVETQYLVKAYYIFEMGKSIMLKRYGYFSLWDGTMYSNDLEKCKGVYSIPITSPKTIISYSRTSIKEAVQGTQFRFSTWESYDYSDMLKFFYLYSKYPCIEYLTKLGFQRLVRVRLEESRTYSAINWNGKTLLKVLRLSKKELKEIKEQEVFVTFLFLRILQLSKKDGSNLSFKEISHIENKYGYYLKELQTVLKYTTLRKVNNYLGKQHKKQPKQFYSESQVLTAWKDYIADCITLRMDLTSEKVLFPGNLYRAHQNTIKQVKIKANEELNKKIQKRFQLLSEKYCFEYRDLMVRPAQSSKELIAEGKALHHCVGTYAERYAAGNTILLLIRKISEPDKPYFTMEVRDNSVFQVHGKDNCNPNEQVKEFVEAFKLEKLQDKKAKSRIRIPA